MKKRLALSETAVIMLQAIGGLFVVFLVLGLLVTLIVYPFEPPLPFAVGLLWGCGSSGAKVILLEKSLGHAVDAEEKKSAQLYATLQAGLRYLLTVGVLLCPFLFRDVFGLFGTILGVVSLQLCAYVAGAVLKRRDTRNKQAAQ